MPVPTLPRDAGAATTALSINALRNQLENLIVITDYMAEYTRDMLKAVSYDDNAGSSNYNNLMSEDIDTEFSDILNNLNVVKTIIKKRGI